MAVIELFETEGQRQKCLRVTVDTYNAVALRGIQELLHDYDQARPLDGAFIL